MQDESQQSNGVALVALLEAEGSQAILACRESKTVGTAVFGKILAVCEHFGDEMGQRRGGPAELRGRLILSDLVGSVLEL